LSEISKNVKQGLDTVFTRIQNCFIIFEDNNPYDDSLLETKIVLKTYEKANIETFIAALSVKESLQNFEIYQKIFEVLGETYLSSEYLSIKTHGIKDLIESPMDKKIASIDFVFDGVLCFSSKTLILSRILPSSIKILISLILDPFFIL